MKLGDICKIKYGKDHKKLNDGSIPVYGSGGVMRHVDAVLWNKPSVLIPRKGTLGNLFYVDEPFWTVDTLFWTDIDAAQVVPKYLFYQLKTKDLASLNVGTAVPSLTTEVLNEVQIDLPSLEKQKQVVEVLGCIDTKIETNAKLNGYLEELMRAEFKRRFIVNAERSDWKTGTFSEIVSSTLSGDWGKEEPLGSNTKKVYCMRGADIPEVKAGNKGKMPIRYILPKNYANKHLSAGDIVVEISGGSPTQSTGRCVAITQSLLDRYDSGMVCTNFCKAIKPLHGYSMFVYYYWQFMYEQRAFFSYENGTTGIKNLDIAGFLSNAPIFIPPADRIIDFDKLCKMMHSQIFANGKQSESLCELRDALLPKLMSGEIDVTKVDLTQLNSHLI